MKGMCADLERRNLSSGLPPSDGFWDLSEFSVKPSDKHMAEFSSDTDAVLINVGDSDSISELSGHCTDDSVNPEIDGLFDGNKICQLFHRFPLQLQRRMNISIHSDGNR